MPSAAYRCARARTAFLSKCRSARMPMANTMTFASRPPPRCARPATPPYSVSTGARHRGGRLSLTPCERKLLSRTSPASTLKAAMLVQDKGCTLQKPAVRSDAVKAIPITLKQANDYVSSHNRHHRPVAGHKFSVGCEINGKLAGIVIAGRPVSRHMDDGLTLEVTRL